MGRIIFFFQEALRAMRRNGAPSVAAIITTVVTVVLLGVLIPIFQTTQAKSNEVRGELNIQAEVFPDATKAELVQLRETLRGVPHVAQVEFITKAQALQELRETLGVEKARELTSQLHENPLPASFRITPDDASNLPSIRTALNETKPDGSKQLSPVLGRTFERQDASKQIEKVTSALKIVLTVITALLVLASLMLIGNTIRLSIYTRRREVEVMRLVGATRWFIRWPFMIEGVIVGFIGGLIAILILWLGKLTIVDPLSSSFSFLAAQNSSTLTFPAMIVILFAASVLVSTLGSGITLRRFLKV
ncbi:MAG TPA: permease-like cell division protein FtsX [Solirubrobacterales bacterium]|jgi:cell division transport system permease protein